MDRLKSGRKTFEEYVAYREGRLRPVKKTVKDPMKSGLYKRESPVVPSGDGIGHVVGKVEKVYTGTFVKGIGVMHKSNAIPITSDEQAVDIARMRRN